MCVCVVSTDYGDRGLLISYKICIQIVRVNMGDVGF